MANEAGVSVFGPFGVDPAYRGGPLGAALLTIALASMRARGAQRALIAAVGERKLVEYYATHANARAAERFDVAAFTPAPVRTVVLASGSGTNFQAVLDRVTDGALPLDLRALVCNKPGAHAIVRAREGGVTNVHVLPWRRAEQTRAAYDAQLLATVAGERPELVLLLGWMHLLETSFVTAFPELINVHPAFLPLDSSRDVVGMPDGTEIPAFRGAFAVRDALAAGSRWAGATVHVVTPQTDRGPVLVRKPLRVEPGDDEAAVLARLHLIEHGLVARGIKRWLFER
jgi:phosphoribosylglycinamide formyltransferase-1